MYVYYIYQFYNSPKLKVTTLLNNLSNSNSDATLTIQMKSLFVKGQKVTSTLKKLSTACIQIMMNISDTEFFVHYEWPPQIPWGVLYIFGGWKSLHLCLVALLGEINSVAQKAHISACYEDETSPCN